MNRIDSFMVAILQNPEFIKQVARRYGSADTVLGYTVGMPEIANAIQHLHKSLSERVFEDEGKPFDIEEFTKDTIPPPPSRQ